MNPSEHSNPYNEIIGDGNPKDIQARYEQHRTQRNANQRNRLLSGELKRLDIDRVLYQILHPTTYPGFVDPRHCLVFWARPPPYLQNLILEVQKRLQEVAPGLWPLPPQNLHMTVMEMTHSLTAPEIAALVAQMKPRIEEITDYTFAHRARLVKPMLCFDASALALSFLPAAGEEGAPQGHDDSYTYHHLRRDLWQLCQSTRVSVASRYVLPSAHLTVSRIVTNADHSSAADCSDDPDGDGKLDPQKMARWLEKIDEINTWLQQNYWPAESGSISSEGQWLVGQGKGLDCKAGTIWYGRDSADSVRLGKGF